ncbi:MAG: hypothetical protein WD356_09410 [Pseudomonadales bacterium]
MKVSVFRQRISQVHDAEAEINEWLQEMEGKIEIHHIKQSAYLTDNSEQGTAGFIISVWYSDR